MSDLHVFQKHMAIAKQRRDVEDADKPRDREQICRFILGKAARTWATTFETLTPSQIIGCIDAFELYPMEEVLACQQILQGWMWFRIAGLATKPPWEITLDDIAELNKRAPWDPSGQLSLFDEGA